VFFVEVIGVPVAINSFVMGSITFYKHMYAINFVNPHDNFIFKLILNIEILAIDKIKNINKF
jgi:hypothetical protein